MEQTSEQSTFHKHRALQIGIGVLLLNIFLIFSLVSFSGFTGIINKSALIFILSYFLVGLYCGKRWHESSWRLAWWLTIPLAVAIILFFPILIASTSTEEGSIIAIGLFVMAIGICFLAFFSSSIGASFGANAHTPPST